LSIVLRQLGYSVAGLAARVVWNKPPDAPTPPRTHMLLRVELEGESHIVDVGFGGMTLTGVLRFVPDIEQSTPHDPFRFIRDGDTYTMQASVRSEWRSMYRFDVQEQTAADYELMSWYTSTHPTSLFLQNLIVARTAPGHRYALLNDEFTTHHLRGASERRKVTSARELRELMEEVFLIQVPQEAAIAAALQRLLQNT
jgi:N-hydroxyarylamine O-acetyltransferase